MNDLHRILLLLMGNAINPDNISDKEVISDNKWVDLYQLIGEQGLQSALFISLNDLSAANKPHQNLYKKWENQIILAAVRQLNNMQQLNALVKIFNDANIQIIVLKGPAISRFYAKPEYRFMSDLDILVSKEDLTRTQQIIATMGYEMEDDGERHPFHYCYIKPAHLCLEIHYSLLAPGILGKRTMQDWYRHIWEYKKKILFNDIELTIMSEEDELIHQVLHFATHLIYSGARMSHIYDMALIIKENDIDWKYVYSELEKMGLLKFASLIFRICNKYFRLVIPVTPLGQHDIIPERFLDDFITYYSIINKNEERKIWYSFAWTHPFLCRSVAATPVMYVIELAYQIIKNKRNIRESLKVTSKNIKIFLNMLKTFRELGLIGS